jgi:hypothetical protein
VSVPLPLLSQSHFRHALLGAGVGHSTPAYKGLFIFARRIGILDDFALKREDMEVQKNIRNSVLTEFRGHPTRDTVPLKRKFSLHRGDTRAQEDSILVEYRAVSCVFQNIDPPPPLHPASVSSPRNKGGGEGGGGQYFGRR